MEKRKGWSRDLIKYIAIITMLCNHIAHVCLTEETVLYEIFVNIGYFTAVPMCFFLAEGVSYTRSVKAYGRRLLIFAILSQIPFVMCFGEAKEWYQTPLNMLFTLFLCFLMLLALEHEAFAVEKKQKFVWCCVLASCICDWAVTAPMCTYWFWEAKGDKRLQGKGFFMAALLQGVMNFFSRWGTYSLLKNLCLTLGNMIPILAAGAVIVCFYNGKRMKKGKKVSQYFFYWFYPVHLLILGMIRISIS